MKKSKCVTVSIACICVFLAFSCVGCKKSEKSETSGPTMVELMEKELTDEYDFAIVNDEGTVLLENEDVSKLFVMYKKGQHRYLELRFTEEGTEKFKKAIKENKRNKLSIMLDGEVFVTPVIANEDTPEYAKITGTYDEIMTYFNKMT